LSPLNIIENVRCSEETRSGVAKSCWCSLEDFTGLVAASGMSARRRLLGATEALCVPLGHTLPIGVEEEAFEAAWEGGRAMTLEQAVAYALQNAPADLF
jgi:hypothetical protein